jgi:hypothetical protein
MECVHNDYGKNNCGNDQCIRLSCPVETLDIPDTSAGMIDGTNIIGIYSTDK